MADAEIKWMKGGKNPQELVRIRKQMAAEGKIKLGRKKGVLNKKTIIKITTEQSFIDEVNKRAGQLADDLFRNSKHGDTRATLGALNRAWGMPRQAIDLKGQVAFSLVELGTKRVIHEQVITESEEDTDELPAA